MVWQFDRPEVGEGVVQAFRRVDNGESTGIFKLRGLNSRAHYRVQDLDETTTQELTGRELMDRGLAITIAAKPGAVVLSYHKIQNKN
jgi:alpha-galactosidase